MITETQNQQPAVNVYPNSNGGNGGLFGEGFGSGGIILWLILFFFMIMFMGWGNFGNNGGNNANASPQFIPYPMLGGGCGDNGYNAAEAVRNGFDQSAIIGGINGLQTTVQNGFNSAEVARCNQQAILMNAFNQQAMSLQNCCCENRAGIADVKYALASEACNDRAAVKDALYDLTAQNNANMNNMANMFNNGLNTLRNDFFQYQMSCKNDRIADLERQVSDARIAGLVNSSRDAVIANNDLQTAALEQYLAPTPRPAFVVQNPNCCAPMPNYNSCNNRCCGQ